MHNIPSSLACFSFNDTAPVQEEKNTVTSVATNSALPAALTLINQPEAELQRLPVAMPSMQVALLRQLEAGSAEQPQKENQSHSATVWPPALSAAKLNTMLATAFDALRVEINTQAGSSNNPHLNALDKLQRRGFKPARGGLEIPFSLNSLLGGGGGAGGSKRVSEFGSTSRDIHVVPTGAGAELRQEISDKKIVFDTLTLELIDAEEEDDTEEIESLGRQLSEVQTDLEILNERYNLLVDEYKRINK